MCRTSPRARGGRRETRLTPTATPNFFRKPYGPGWALVGDAGYLKDPVTGQGIQDAFRDAESCVAALDQALDKGRPYDAAMADYQRSRDDDVLAMFEFTCMLATLDPPTPELAALLAAVEGDRAAMDAFVQVNAGTLSPAKFFDPQNVEAILSAGRSRAEALQER